MNTSTWMYLLAASGHLTLAVMCLVRGARSPLARPLAWLYLAMFGWCFSSAADHLSPAAGWGALDEVCTAATPPLVLHLVMVFVGARRARSRYLIGVSAFFGCLALSSLVKLSPIAGFGGLPPSSWNVAFLVGWIPALGLIGTLLFGHLGQSVDPEEQARTRIFMAALLLGGLLGTVDILDRWLQLGLPRVASVGTFLAACLVAIAAFRFRLFDRDLSVSTGIYAGSLAVLGTVAYVVLARVMGSNAAALTFGMLTVTLVLGAAFREVAASRAAHRERVDRLAVMGRFASQMAHDLKNPLAALQGALQFLQEERAQGRTLDAHHEFLGVMLDQVQRLHRVIDDYQRIGRVEPMPRSVDLNALVRAVASLEAFAAPGVTIDLQLAPELPACELDADLVSGALENLVRNALEAMPQGGRITVRTAAVGDQPLQRVALSVIDTGTGMDARRAERAFDDFYTTKPTGSGLGLAFVRRVAEAHRGQASLRTQVGVGTDVRVELPVR